MNESVTFRGIRGSRQRLRARGRCFSCRNHRRERRWRGGEVAERAEEEEEALSASTVSCHLLWNRLHQIGQWCDLVELSEAIISNSLSAFYWEIVGSGWNETLASAVAVAGFLWVRSIYKSEWDRVDGRWCTKRGLKLQRSLSRSRYINSIGLNLGHGVLSKIKE